MIGLEQISATVFKAVDTVNPQLPLAKQLPKSMETGLFGREGKLDSLELVNLIVATEEVLQEDLGVSLTLADETAMSQKESPFRNLGTLIRYIHSRVNP